MEQRDTEGKTNDEQRRLGTALRVTDQPQERGPDQGAGSNDNRLDGWKPGRTHGRGGSSGCSHS